MGNFSRCFGVFDLRHSRRHKLPSSVTEELCHRFSLAQLQKSTNNFDQSRMIDSDGISFGYKGCINIGGTDYTVLIKRFVKKYDQSEPNRQLSEFKNEIQLLCQLHHPNLVSLIGFCEEKKELILVYEYTSNRSLYHHLHHRDRDGCTPLSWKRRLEICIGAARGLRYLHTGAKHTIYHRDIRSYNILLDENWVPKLSGFGISLRGPSFTSKVESIQVDVIRAKVGFLPLEYALSGTLTDKCDVFLFGLIMLEVVTGATVSNIYLRKMCREDEDYYEYNLAEGIRNFAEKGNADKVVDPYILGKIAPECWKIYMDIAESCLLREATERPTIGEVQLELERALDIQEEADAMPGTRLAPVTPDTKCGFPQSEMPNNVGIAAENCDTSESGGN